MKIRLIFILQLVLLGSLCLGQTVTVFDSETKIPIPLVTLINDSLKEFSVTDKKGEADISAFKNAEKIVVRIINYNSKIISYKELESLNFKLQLDRSVITIDEMIISATKWNQNSQNIPARIISVNPKDITLYNPQTAADLLSSSGEVYIQKSQQGGGSPMIRGFATNRLLYSIDGVRMNTAIFRNGNIQNVISLDPFAIEKTEIFFGPGSVMYGSDAIGGVMSFNTLNPKLSLNDTILFKGNAITRYTSANNEMTGHADINIGTKKFSSLTSFSYNNYGDLKMGTNGPDDYLRKEYVTYENGIDIVKTNNNELIQIPTAYSQYNIMQKFRYKVDENLDIKYGFHYSTTSDYDRYDRHLRTKKGLPRYAEWKYGPQIWMMNQISILTKADSTFYDELNANISHQYFKESRINRDLFDTDRFIRTEEVQAISVNLDFLKNISSKNKLFYGLEYVRNNVHSSGIVENINTGTISEASARYPESNWSSYAVYLNDQHKINDKISIQTGIRYNKYTLVASFDTSFYPLPFDSASINNGALTGSFGFVLKPNEKLIINTNFSTGFRSPNVDDMGKIFDSEPGSVVVPNPDLKGEYAYNSDLSIAKLFGENIKVNFTAYYTLLTNALVRRDYTLNGSDSIYYDGEMSKVQSIQNAAQASVYGLQGGFEIKIKPELVFSSKINYQQGIEELDNGTTSPLRHSAPVFGSTYIKYSKNKLSLNLYSNYNGAKSYEKMPESEIEKDYLYAKDSNGNPYSPSWYTLNFKGLYNVTDFLSITCGVENITNVRYKPYSSGIAAAGRNYIISARLTF